MTGSTSVAPRGAPELAGARAWPVVATGVAAGLLRSAGAATTATGGLLHVEHELTCRVSWSGPLELALRSEADVQAACGVMQVHGRRYGAPTPLRADFASVAAGVLAATGTLAALRARQLGAGYRAVEVSVAQAALLGLSQYLAAATAADESCAEPDGVGGPPFRSADGVWFELEALEADGWLRFWGLLGVERRSVGRSWLPFQSRYGTATCPLPDELFAAARVVTYRRVVHAAAEAGVGVTVAVARPPVAGGVPWRLRAGDPVAVVEAAGRDGAGPLAGVTVVEIARRVQGPLAGRVLSLLGARVVRVEPVGGDPLRGVPPVAVVGGVAVSARFAALNRGKEVLEADLRSPEGRSAVRELLHGADVLLHSLAPAKVGGLGLDPETVAALHPGLVYVQASGGAPGLTTDFPVQAHSGLAALLAPEGGVPRPTLLTVCDVLGGLVCAAGAAAGLAARARTGRAQRVESSLLSAARLLCGAAGVTGGRSDGVEVCTDLAALAADPRLAAAFELDGCAIVRPPWEFRSW
ncbi:CoA transferase [Streptomyces sp. TLI_171]|uniref:CoA transferase n=1 Tax=Streptomyces sp. TLI_171 TaxID=1938859 RepID=UPI000C5018EC|nr:CoA transferase [Streptomyces sp. TLI_171]RKE18158.1 CoA transferase family III [Streptomyces sp. TLI_171]